MINILLVDDHQLVRKGIRALLEHHANLRVVAEASNGHEALVQIERLHPDLVLLDIVMPGRNGLEVATDILRLPRAPRILLLTMSDIAEYVSEALKLGIHGYVAKDAAPTELFSAIDTVMRDEVYVSPSISRRLMSLLKQSREKEALTSSLTPRQLQILKLIALGYSSKSMAVELNLSIKTIETHRSQLMQRLGVKDVASLVRHALRTGLIKD